MFTAQGSVFQHPDLPYELVARIFSRKRCFAAEELVDRQLGPDVHAFDIPIDFGDHAEVDSE
jgi:hypothetical protein